MERRYCGLPTKWANATEPGGAGSQARLMDRFAQCLALIQHLRSELPLSMAVLWSDWTGSFEIFVSAVNSNHRGSGLLNCVIQHSALGSLDL